MTAGTIILFYINISYNSIHHFGTGTGSVIPSHSCYSTRSTRNSLPSISGLYFLCCYPQLLPPLSLPRVAVGHNSTKNTGLKSMGAIFDQNTDLHFLCRFIPTFAAFRQNSFSFAHRHTEVSHFIWGCGGKSKLLQFTPNIDFPNRLFQQNINTIAQIG